MSFLVHRRFLGHIAWQPFLHFVQVRQRHGSGSWGQWYVQVELRINAQQFDVKRLQEQLADAHAHLQETVRRTVGLRLQLAGAHENNQRLEERFAALESPVGDLHRQFAGTGRFALPVLEDRVAALERDAT